MSTPTTEPGARVLHPGNGHPCFHPGDEDGEPTARHFEPGNGHPCFHPGDGDREPTARHFEPADDLAADLHLALTSIDERQLAVLAGNRS
jgi:hypothetical protein